MSRNVRHIMQRQTQRVSMRLTVPMVMISCILSFAGCFIRSDIEKEFRTLAVQSASALGSDFVTGICGWPTDERLNVKSLSVELTPDSTSSNGAGTVEVSAVAKAYPVSGKVFFVYTNSVAGGHGISNSDGLTLAVLQRTSSVDSRISNPEKYRSLEMGVVVKASLSDSSVRLPDGSFAEYFACEMKGDKPAVRVTLTSETRGVVMKGCYYQNGMMISGFNSTGERLKPGKVFLLVVSRNKGAFSLAIQNLSESEKSILK